MAVGTAVLQEIAPLVCPVPDRYADRTDLYHKFRSEDNVIQFECIAAVGHMTDTTLSWTDNQTEADVAFDTTREEQSVLVNEYHGYPLLMWTEDHPSFPGGRQEIQVWLWQAGRWLIEIRAFDDTHFEIAPNPESVADALYDAGQAHGLFNQNGQ